MTENKEIKKGKKTLSLKLGSKPIISNKRGIEAGKTVIVEKKRYKRNTNTDQKPEQASPSKKEATIASNETELFDSTNYKSDVKMFGHCQGIKYIWQEWYLLAVKSYYYIN